MLLDSTQYQYHIAMRLTLEFQRTLCQSYSVKFLPIDLNSQVQVGIVFVTQLFTVCR